MTVTKNKNTAFLLLAAVVFLFAIGFSAQALQAKTEKSPQECVPADALIKTVPGSHHKGHWCGMDAMVAKPAETKMPNRAETKIPKHAEIKALKTDNDIQVIRLVRMTKRDLEKGLIQGSGYAVINNGAGYWFWESTTPPHIQISWKKLLKEMPEDCEEHLMNSAYPKQMVVLGRFTGTAPQGTFALTRIFACDSGNDSKATQIEEILNQYSEQLLQESDAELVSNKNSESKQ